MNPDIVRKLSYGLLAFLAVLAFGTFKNYGVTWDEEFHRAYGEFILSWYRTFFRDHSAFADPYMNYYGGFFDIMCALLARISPWKVFETRHLAGAFMGLIVLWYSRRIAVRLAGETAGLLTLILLAVFPAYYGHQFANPVDIPFAAFFTAALYYLIRLLEAMPDPPLRVWLKLGAAAGMMLSVRFSGIAALALTCILTAVLHLFRDGQLKQIRIKSFGQHLMIAVVLAWVIMLLSWPWAQLNPLTHPWIALLKSMSWEWPRMVFFDGQWFKAAAVPPVYLIQSLLISTPEFFMLSLLIAAGTGLIHLLQRKEQSRAALYTAVIFPLIFSLIVNAFVQKTKFDGFRHYLFMLPLFAVLGGCGLAVFLRARISAWLKYAAGFVLCFSLVVTIADMIRLHPYQTVYFNRLFVGGLKGSFLKYETDYWGSSYKEGIEWVIKNYKPDLGRKIRVRNSSGLFQVGYYLATNPEAKNRFEAVTDHPDVFLSTTRWGKHRMYAGKVIYTVERDGVPLLYVVETLKQN